jgi:hypothetical protein
MRNDEPKKALLPQGLFARFATLEPSTKHDPAKIMGHSEAQKPLSIANKHSNGTCFLDAFISKLYGLSLTSANKRIFLWIAFKNNSARLR